MLWSDGIWEAVLRVRAIHIRDQSGPGATVCQFVTTERSQERGGEVLSYQQQSIHQDLDFLNNCYISKC